MTALIITALYLFVAVRVGKFMRNVDNNRMKKELAKMEAKVEGME